MIGWVITSSLMLRIENVLRCGQKSPSSWIKAVIPPSPIIPHAELLCSTYSNTWADSC